MFAGSSFLRALAAADSDAEEDDRAQNNKRRRLNALPVHTQPDRRMSSRLPAPSPQRRARTSSSRRVIDDDDDDDDDDEDNDPLRLLRRRSVKRPELCYPIRERTAAKFVANPANPLCIERDLSVACDICLEIHVNESWIIKCAGCKKRFHTQCYGGIKESERGDRVYCADVWYCVVCRLRRQTGILTLKPADLICVLCWQSDGVMKLVSRETVSKCLELTARDRRPRMPEGVLFQSKHVFAHVICALKFPNIGFESVIVSDARAGDVEDVLGRIVNIDELPAEYWSFARKCALCRKGRGAMVQCDESDCEFSWHPSCAKDECRLYMEDVAGYEQAMKTIVYRCPWHEPEDRFGVRARHIARVLEAPSPPRAQKFVRLRRPDDDEAHTSARRMISVSEFKSTVRSKLAPLVGKEIAEEIEQRFRGENALVRDVITLLQSDPIFARRVRSGHIAPTLLHQSATDHTLMRLAQRQVNADEATANDKT